MKIGIIGKPQVGKSTFFNLLTGSTIHSKNKTQLAIGKIPDKRLNVLADINQVQKIIQATIDFVYVPGFQGGQNSNSRNFLQAISDVEAIALVVRAFNSTSVPSYGGINPHEEFNEIQQELLIADWTLLENRLERIAKQKTKNPVAQEELALLNKCKEYLENNLPLRQMELDEGEGKILQGYDFLTKKPLIVAVNLDEEQMLANEFPNKEQLSKDLAEMGIPYVLVSAQVEAEIKELEDEDAQIFMEELGITELGIAKLARAVFAHLDLVSFFTAGEKEAHSWTIRRGDNAQRAAGKIHSDIERGFIRAEVVSYDDYVRLGSMQKIKEEGLFRLEGKDYLVQDGDVVNFRFNV